MKYRVNGLQHRRFFKYFLHDASMMRLLCERWTVSVPAANPNSEITPSEAHGTVRALVQAWTNGREVLGSLPEKSDTPEVLCLYGVSSLRRTRNLRLFLRYIHLVVIVWCPKSSDSHSAFCSCDLSTLWSVENLLHLLHRLALCAWPTYLQGFIV